MTSVITGYELNCSSTKTAQLPCDVPLKFLPYLKTSQVFAPFYNYLGCTCLIFSNIYLCHCSLHQYILSLKCSSKWLQGEPMFVWSLYGARANCFLMCKYEHECVHAPTAAEVCELEMCSILPTDFVPVLKRDGFVCPVLHYAYKLCISKPGFWFHNTYLHDWL